MFKPHRMRGNAKRYFDFYGADDYFAKGCEQPGRFFGSGLEDVGLKQGQLVTEKPFCNLFEGSTPDGKEKLVQNAGKEDRENGMDGVFSLPKDLSIAYARMTPEERVVVDAKLLEIVKEVMDHFEKTYATSRIGRGGEDHVKAKLIWAAYQHITARTQNTKTPDMHVHIHVVVFNACTRGGENGKVDSGAVELQDFYTRQKLLSAMFDTAMYQVFRDLRYLTEGQGKECRLEAVPKPLCEEFSKRAQAVEAEMRRAGQTGHEAHERAWHKTREKKRDVPRDELFSSWQADLDSRGFTQNRFSSHRQMPPTVSLAEELVGALDRAAKNLTKGQSYFSNGRYLEEVCIEARGRGLSLDVIQGAVRVRLKNAHKSVDLGRLEKDDLYTTPEMMELEKKLLAEVRETKGKNLHRASDASLLRAIRETEAAGSKNRGEKVKLTDEQVAAIYHLARGEDGIAVLTGDAGTGKTTTLTAVRKALSMDGYDVIGCALAKKAALGLQEGTGIKSTSLAKLIGSEELAFKGDFELSLTDHLKEAAHQVGRALKRSIYDDLKDTPLLGRLLPEEWRRKPYQAQHVKITEKTVLVVDEAAMVGTRQMEKLIRQVREQGGKVILVGDAKQLQAIEAGNPFRAISDILGEARLTQIIRQRKEEDRQAVRALARGDAHEAFGSYVKRGLLHIAISERSAQEQMIADWKKEGLKKAKDNLLLCATNAERRSLNLLAQSEMKKAGHLGRRAFTAGGEDFHRGDRIAFTRNSAYYGIQNGSMGAIQRIGTKRITRKTFHGKQFHSLYAMLKYAEQIKKDKSLWMTVKLDSGEVVDIPLERYRDFRLGYALNTHQAQGQTVDNVFILTGGPTLDREMIYVQASRARNSPQIYSTALDAEGSQPQADTVANLAKRAAKSRAKELAHDVQAKAKVQAERQVHRLRLRIHH